MRLHGHSTRELGHGRSPTDSENPAETLLGNIVPTDRLFYRIVNCWPGTQTFFIQFPADGQQSNPRHKFSKVIDIRDYPEKIHDSPVHIVINLYGGEFLVQQNRSPAAEGFYIGRMGGNIFENEFLNFWGAFAPKPMEMRLELYS